MLKKGHNKILKTLLTIRLLIIGLLVVACSSTKKVAEMSPVKSDYEFRDKSGSYHLKRESGPIAKDRKLFAVKQVLTGKSSEGRQEVMERSVVVTRAGKMKGRFVWRPEKSEYVVWFDGQEYSTKTYINEKIRGLKVVIENPDVNNNKSIDYPFPDGTGVFCYFSQVIECASSIGFIAQAIGVGNGQMNFHIIWEGYPYFQQQYVGIPEEIVSTATLSYDGESEQGIRRFSLSIANQVIFYQLNKMNELHAIFWPAQGLSVGARGSLE